nr:helix-turn-helix domain-containing protein [Candidatus Sigynarchaeota archaeon]
MDNDAFFDLMGNEVRRKILKNLAQGPMSISELNELIDVSRQAILKHLKDMEEKGFIEAREADERVKKTGPNPQKYTLKQFFTVHFDMNPNTPHPRIFTLNFGNPFEQDENAQELPQSATKTSIKSYMADVAAMNKKLEDISASYKEVLDKKNTALRMIAKIVERTVPDGEEREVIKVLMENPEKAVTGFTIEEIAIHLRTRRDFMKFILDNLIKIGILKQEQTGLYVLT